MVGGGVVVYGGVIGAAGAAFAGASFARTSQDSLRRATVHLSPFTFHLSPLTPHPSPLTLCQALYREFDGVGALEDVEEDDGAFFAFAAGEDGFQVFEGAVGDGDFFSGSEVAVATFLAVGLGA